MTVITAQIEIAVPECHLTMEDGVRVDLHDPDPEFFAIERIATGLARIPRWAGHTTLPWTVAEHSVWVADRLPPPIRLQGLLHDAAECVMGDMPGHLKAHLPAWRAWEAQLSAAIAQRYGLPAQLDPRVKRLDRLSQAVETRDLRPGAFEAPAGVATEPPLEPLEDWRDIRDLFLDRYDALAEMGLAPSRHPHQDEPTGATCWCGGGLDIDWSAQAGATTVIKTCNACRSSWRRVNTHVREAGHACRDAG